MDKKLMKKNFIWNVIGSGLTAFNSLFFMIIVTRINGIDDAGLFTFAFSTACFLYMIGIYSGRTYQVTESDVNISDSDYIYSKFFTCFIMIIVGIIFCIFRRYDITKSVVILGLVLLKSVEAFCEGIYAIIQENNELYRVGISQTLKAILTCLGLVIVDLLTHNLILSILAMLIIMLVITILYDFKNVKKVKFKLGKFNYVSVKNTLVFGFATFAFSFLTQYVINAPRYAIDSLSTSSIQAVFGIIIMPSTIIALLGQFILQPFLVSLKDTLKKDKNEFLKLTIKLLIAIIIIGVLSCVFMYFFAITIFKIMYNLDLQKYLGDLMIIMFGGSLYEITVILSTALITMRSTVSQLIIYSIVSIFAFVGSNILVKNYGIFGAVSSYSLSMGLLLVLYIIVFIYVFKKYKKKLGE